MSFKDLSFIDLFEKEGLIVEIPMLQRDYAYGRATEAEKRSEFLTSLKQYLSSNINNELDFIYGSTSSTINPGEKSLILLDGQQRVTTLFLLHWYLALACNCYDDFRKLLIKDGKSKFTYKTRESSTAFCNALVMLEKNEKDQKEEYFSYLSKYKTTDKTDEKNYFSYKIKNEKWFFRHWENDPTVSNMLNMLDAIANVFPVSECAGFYEKLNKSGKSSSISFNLLPFDEYGLTDELYIKMNSRGKPLTRFENLKSMLLKECDELKGSSGYKTKLAEINKAENKEYDSLRDYIGLMLDTRWTDTFWNFWLSNKSSDKDEKPCIDDMFFSFISNFCISFFAVNKMIEHKTFSMKKNGKTEKYIDSLMNAKNKISYNRIIEIFKDNDGELIYKLIDILNLLSEKDNENTWKLKTYFDSQVYFFDEMELFKTIVYDYRNKADRNYESKFIYFAYISYLLAYKPCKNDKLFKDWIRFVYNLAKNSYTLSNAVYTFCNALRAINYLQDKDIYHSLLKKKFNDIVTIDKYQLEEEILKAKLFNSPSKENIDWKAAIETSYDKLRYFEGQLYYALIDYSAITEADYNDNTKFNSFNSCVEKLSAIFNDENEGCKSSVDINLVKALLSKGSYLTEYNRSYSLYQNGKNRDISWLRFIKKETSGDDKRKFLKAVIDDKDFDIKNVKKSLETISNNSKANVNEEWRLKLIDKLEAFQTRNKDLENYSFGNKRLLRWNRSITNDSSNWDNWEIDLISKITITSRHAELFTYSLYLDNKDVDIVPFGKPYYILQSSNDSMPFMVYGAFEYSGNDYFLQIFYAGNKQYDLRFLNWKDDKVVLITDNIIITEAINAGFTASCNIYKKLVNENNVITEIKKFSSALTSNIKQ